MNTPALRVTVMALMIALLTVGPMQAADYYWDADGDGSAAIGGTGNWDTTSLLWRLANDTGTLSAWPIAGRNNDVFLTGATGTLTLIAGISVNDITVNPSAAGTYTIAGTTQTLTLNGSTQSVLDIATGSTLTITSGLAGMSGFTKNSAGTLILDGTAGSNALVGSINVNGGTLQVGSATNSSASQVLRSNAVTLGSGATLTSAGTTIDIRLGSLSGSGSITQTATNGAALNILALSDATSSASISNSGGTNANAGITLRGGNGTTQTFTGNLTGVGGTIGINLGATFKVSGTGDSTSGVLGASTIAMRGGTFTMDNTGGNTSAASGRLSDTAAVTFLSGTFSLIGNSAGTSETVGNLTLNPGSATISVTHNGGASGTQLTFTDSGSLRNTTTMTVNFVGSGGTLGSTGANPRIGFTGAIFTNTTSGLLADTSGASVSTVGWARVNTTEWAGVNGSNQIVALSPTLTTATNTGLQTGTANSITVFNPSAGQTLTGASTHAVIKISPGSSGLSLDLSTFNLTASAVMLTGANTFTISGSTGALFGTGGSSRYAYVTDPDGLLNVSTTIAASNPLTKSGPGTLALTGSAAQYAPGSNTNLAIVEGVLRGTLTNLNGGTSAGGAFTKINFRGGVLEISGGGTFSRAMLSSASTAAGGTVQWDNGGSDRGDGGFSAINGNATVTLVTAIAGSTAATPIWNDGVFASNGYALIMGSTKADSRIDFTNNIGLDNTSVTGGSTNNYFAREVRVVDNTSSSTDVARLSGVISGSTNADLLKTGDGVLELTNTNTYLGNTIIQQGTLLVTNGAALPNSGAVILANISGATLKLNNSETIGALTGGGATGGNVNLQGNTLTVGDQRDSTYAGVINGSGGSLAKLGTGSLTLAGINTYTGGTTITAGKIILGNGQGLPSAGDVILSGGTLSTAGGIGGAGIGTTSALGTLKFTTASTIELGTGDHILSFTSIDNSSTGSLTITGWTGPIGQSGTAGKIFFPSLSADPNTDFASFLSKVSFDNFAGSSGLLITSDGGTTYQLVPAAVPEPSTVLGCAAAGLGLVQLLRRHRRPGVLPSQLGVWKQTDLKNLNSP